MTRFLNAWNALNHLVPIYGPFNDLELVDKIFWMIFHVTIYLYPAMFTIRQPQTSILGKGVGGQVIIDTNSMEIL